MRKATMSTFDENRRAAILLTQIEQDAPSSNTVVLRGVSVALGSDVGSAFVTDCTRHIESALSEAELKNKWGLSDGDWAALANNAPLLSAVRVERERRILSGECAREAAQ